MSASEPPALAVVGAPALADRLRRAGLAVGADVAAATTVVVGGPPGDRVARAREVVSGGGHAFLLWPPGVSAGEAATLGARAEEAGVEVGVARPLGLGVLAGRPDEWTARLVTVTAVAAPAGRLLDAGWPALLASALDLTTTLAASRDVARLDAEAERDGGRLRAVALSARFRTGALAQVLLRSSEQVAADEVWLYASRPGSRIEARSLDGPLCVEAEGRPAVLAPTSSWPPDVAEVAAFVAAVRAGRPAPYALDDALGTLRLVERVQARLR